MQPLHPPRHHEAIIRHFIRDLLFPEKFIVSDRGGMSRFSQAVKNRMQDMCRYYIFRILHPSLIQKARDTMHAGRSHCALREWQP